MKAIISVFVLLISSLFAPVASPQRKSLALVEPIKGTVIVRTAKGKEDKIKTAKLLYEGDTVETGQDGWAALYQRYARFEKLIPNGSKQIKQLPYSSAPDVFDANRYAKIETIVIQSLRDTKRPLPGTQGGPRDLVFYALTARNSLILDEHPTFEWTPVEKAKSYTLALYDADQKELIWQATTKESRVTYPYPGQGTKAKRLSPGKYRWEVTAELDRGSLYDATVFTIPTQAQANAARVALERAEKLVTDKSVANLIYITACFEHRLYPRAEDELKKALKRTPDDVTLWALLMKAYEYMKLNEDHERVRLYLENPTPSALNLILSGDASPEKK